MKALRFRDIFAAAAVVVAAVAWRTRDTASDQRKEDPIKRFCDDSVEFEVSRYEGECRVVVADKNTPDTLSARLYQAADRHEAMKEKIAGILKAYDGLKKGDTEKEYFQKYLSGPNAYTEMRLVNNEQVKGMILVISYYDSERKKIGGTLYVNEKLDVESSAALLRELLIEVNTFASYAYNSVLKSTHIEHSMKGSYTLDWPLRTSPEGLLFNSCVFNPKGSEKYQWKADAVNAGPVTSAPADVPSLEAALP